MRMLNEFAYCPRLFHLMHVEGRWADNVYTVEGKQAHTGEWTNSTTSYPTQKPASLISPTFLLLPLDLMTTNHPP